MNSPGNSPSPDIYRNRSWDAGSNDINTLRQYAYIKRVLDTLADKKILDLGGGSAQNTLQCLGRGNFVVDLDINLEQLSYLRPLLLERSDHPFHMICGDAAGLSFKSESFDYVVSTEVITTMPRSLHQPMLDEAARVLRPGGTFFITVHSLEGIVRRLGQSAKSFLDAKGEYHGNARHCPGANGDARDDTNNYLRYNFFLTPLTEEELKALGEKAGFVVESVSYLNFYRIFKLIKLPNRLRILVENFLGHVPLIRRLLSYQIAVFFRKPER